MELYVILRRSGWAQARSSSRQRRGRRKVGNEEMPDDVRWIRSYVLDEGDGSVGTVCIYEATSPEAIRKHASLADLPVGRDHSRRRHGPRATGPAAGRVLALAAFLQRVGVECPQVTLRRGEEAAREAHRLQIVVVRGRDAGAVWPPPALDPLALAGPGELAADALLGGRRARG